MPVAVETMDPWDAQGLEFIKEVGRRMSRVSNDPRELQFLFQRLSVAVQRGNAASVMGSMPRGQEEEG